jgi:signal transduction histidine kinase
MVDIEKHTLLSFLEPEMAQGLIEQAQIDTRQENDVIFQENNVDKDIYLILSGAVRVVKKDPSGKEQLLAILKENDYFGEYAVIDGQPRSASAIAAMAETVLAKIPGEQMLRVFHKSGQHAELKMLLHIIRNVRANNESKVTELLRKERSSLLGEMASSIIHDLKNPTAIISMNIEMLKMDGLNKGQEERCDTILSYIRRMTAMVNEVLDFSRGAPTIVKAEVDIAKIFKEIEKLNRLAMEKAGIKLVIPSITQKMVVDENKIVRVLQNLIGNAADILKAGEGVITVGCEKKEDFFLITVADNGPGIPQDMQACLFDAFTSKGKSKGTGLGMAITKSIVEAHGGTIRFTTGLDSGTTFLIQIPYASTAVQ